MIDTEINQDNVAVDISNSTLTAPDIIIPRHKSIISVSKIASGEKILTVVDEVGSELAKSANGKKKKRKKWYNCLGNNEKEDDLNFREISKDYLNEVLSKQGYDIHKVSFQALLKEPIADSMMEYMSLATSYTITHYFGIPGPTRDSPARLFCLLPRLQLPPRPPLQALPPAYRLQLRVVEARGLDPMDADGLSDPFCRAYLQGDERHAQRSEAMHKSLHPVWNHTFWFDLKDFRADVAHVEVWDSDPKGLAANIKQVAQVKSLRGCMMCCQDVFESMIACGRSSVDDFMGSAKLEIGKMFADGFDDWLIIETEKGKEAGEVHVRANVEVERPQKPDEALRRHLMLVRICMESHAKSRESASSADTSEDSISEWEQVLPRAAETLIFQHRLQSGVLHCEDLMCKTIVVVELAFLRAPFTFSFIYNLLSAAQEAVTANPMRGGDEISTAYQMALFDLHDICIIFLKELHAFDVVENVERRSEVEFNLRSIVCIHAEGAPKEKVWSVLKGDAKAWLEAAVAKFKKGNADEVVAFLKTFKNRMGELDGIVSRVFPGKTYTGCVYKYLEGGLCDSLEWQVKKAVEESLSAIGEERVGKYESAIQLYSTLKDAVDYISKTLSVKSFSLQLGQFRAWFGIRCIEEWFSYKEAYVCSRLQIFVLEDELENEDIEISDRLELATKGCKKASDIVEDELVGLWNVLREDEWKETMVWALHRSCWCYATAMVDLVSSRGLDPSDPEGLKGLCALTNSLWAMGMYAAGAVKRTVGKLEAKWPCTKFSFQLVVKILCQDFAIELWPQVADAIRKVAKAKKMIEQERAIEFYKQFMSQVYHSDPKSNLCLEAYILFQDCLWTWILREVSSVMKPPKAKSCLKRTLTFCWRDTCCPLEGLKALLEATEDLKYDFKKKIKKVREEESKQVYQQLEDFMSLK